MRAARLCRSGSITTQNLWPFWVVISSKGLATGAGPILRQSPGPISSADRLRAMPAMRPRGGAPAAIPGEAK